MWIGPSNRPGAPRAARYFVPTGAIIADTFTPAEFSGGATAHGVWIAPANRLGHSRAARYFVVGGSVVTADTIVPLEFGDRQQGDTKFALENLGTGAIDASVAAEFGGRQQADNVLPLENLGAAVIADALLRLELLAGVLDDVSAPAESTASASVTGDALGYLEWLGSLIEDPPFPVESLARAVCDLAAQIENLSTAAVVAGGDSSLPIELTTRLIGDEGLPLAWALSVTVTADPLSLTSGPFEIAPPTPRPAPVRIDMSGIRVRLLRGD
jgi:hypothetical protein